MKVLLVGFSSQSADVLRLLIEKIYPEYKVVQLERAFGEDLRLCLPTVAMTHSDAEAMIIHLDGVGMMNFSTQHPKMLRQFIGARAALMITKSGLLAWESSHILPKDFGIFVSSPYTKDVMEWALGRLFKAVPHIFDHRHLFHQESGDVHLLSDGEKKADTATANKTSSRHDNLHRLIDVHFNINKKDLFHQFLNLILEETPLTLVAGSQTLYINKKQNLALVSNLERLLDYCRVANNFDVLTKVIEIGHMTSEEFAKTVHQATHNRFHKYGLSTILWQMYDRILPKYIEVPDHKLQLKMRLMPNFGQMGYVPEYIKALTSLCLVSPKTADELSRGLGISIDKAVINRIFILAILSGVADFDVLEASFLENQDTPEKATEMTDDTATRQVNQGVEKAQKTGFLKRLLSKLSLR